jgi:peptidoglycan/xylan/chitin deacetylase (PgdA/CDA1 family)
MNGEKKIIASDVISGDWESSSGEIRSIVDQQTQNGSIIVLHDGSQKSEEIENRPAEMFKALPGIIEGLKKRFRFVRLDELDLKNISDRDGSFCK